MSNLWSQSRQHPAGYREATPAQVHAERGAVRVVDVREPSEFTGELGHIPGAELVPLSRVGGAAQAWDKAQPVIVVCRSGGRSGQAAGALARAGFQRVINMSGGMLGWSEARLAIER